MSENSRAATVTRSIATLSMYDWPETRPALDTLWRHISRETASRGIDTPSELHHEDGQMALWTDPDLLIGQTCGWPYANLLHDKVVPFARFDYGLQGIPSGYYQSVFIMARTQAGKAGMTAEQISKMERIAINGPDSQSGFHVFAEIGGKPATEFIPTEKRLLTGAHRESVKAVAAGKADLAAIDGVAFELAKRFEPEAVACVSVIGSSTPRPGLPLITSAKNAAKSGMLFEAVSRAVDSLPAELLEQLLIRGVVPAESSDYDSFAA